MPETPEPEPEATPAAAKPDKKARQPRQRKVYVLLRHGSGFDNPPTEAVVFSQEIDALRAHATEPGRLVTADIGESIPLV